MDEPHPGPLCPWWQPLIQMLHKWPRNLDYLNILAPMYTLLQTIGLDWGEQPYIAKNPGFLPISGRKLKDLECQTNLDFTGIVFFFWTSCEPINSEFPNTLSDPPLISWGFQGILRSPSMWIWWNLWIRRHQRLNNSPAVSQFPFLCCIRFMQGS